MKVRVRVVCLLGCEGCASASPATFPSHGLLPALISHMTAVFLAFDYIETIRKTKIWCGRKTSSMAKKYCCRDNNCRDKIDKY